MNLLIRLIATLLSCWRAPRVHILDQVRLRFLVWPNDLDNNLHMNNGRYLTIMDLGRLALMTRLGLVPVIAKRRWAPVVGGILVRFRKSLSPFQRYTLTTRVLGWDEKWVYLQHSFDTPRGPACIAVVRACFRIKGGTVPSAEIMEVLGYPDLVSPPLPEAVQKWSDAEQELTNQTV